MSSLISTKTIATTALFWEVIMMYKRRTNDRILFVKAVERAYEQKKNLLIIGEEYRIDAILSHNKIMGGISEEILEEVNPLYLYDEDTFLDIGSPGETVVLTYYNLEDTDSFEYWKEKLSAIYPEDIFCVQHQPWSLTAYLRPFSVPKRVILFTPPDKKFIYWISNPVRSAKAMIALFLIMLTVYMRLYIYKSI